MLVTIFLIATLIRTLRVPLWKSSQLAVLYAMGEPDKLGTVPAMEKDAKRTRMKFNSLGNWQLKQD